MVEKIEETLPERKAEKKIITIASLAKASYLRVAAYCRVSTEMTDQDGSIEIQEAHFRQMIALHPEWQFVGIYEERVSGTHLEDRRELNRLLYECRKGRVDLVLVKSVSRLARNVTDLLVITRELVDLGVDILFEKENIDTRNGNGELILTLFATVAQEEVYSISENNRWAVHKRFQDGTYQFPSAPYGYDLRKGGFSVNDREAAIVRKVFSEYLSGRGTGAIAAGMNAAGVPLKRYDQNWKKYNGVWTRQTVSGILRNETYLGNALLQKTFYDSSFRRRQNTGEYPQYLWEGHHDALIDEESFNKAGKLLDRRVEESHASRLRKRSLLSGKLICAECGSVFYREEDRRKSKLRVYWNCPEHRSKSHTCSMGRVLEDDVKSAFRTVMNKLHYADEVLLLYKKEVQEQWRKEKGEKLISIEKRIEMAQSRLIREKDRSVFYREAQWELLALEKEYRTLDPPDLEPVDELRSLAQGWKDEGFPEKDFLHYIDYITVLSPQYFRFTFACGFEAVEGEK